MKTTPAEVGSCSQARRSPAVAALACLLLVPSVAAARWGEQSWGELVWGQAAAQVPAIAPWGIGVLGALLVAVGVAWRRRSVRSDRDRG
jgi:hypothetical protein